MLALGWEDPLEEGKATHSSLLAWRTLWTEEPGGLWSTGLQRVGHDLSDLFSSLSHSIVFLHLFAFITEEGFLISPCSLELCIQMGISFLFPFAFTFSSFLSYL